MKEPSEAKVSLPFVQTVLGRIPADELGATLTHEHITADWPWALGQTNRRDESAASFSHICSVIEASRAAGTGALVDVGTESFGPSPMLLLAVASRVPVHIICSTGAYAMDRLPLPGWALPPTSSELIAERFLHTAKHGIFGSGVKPGIIKIATGGHEINEMERRVFEGAALAQAQSGLAITTHTDVSARALDQANILLSAGADAERTVIGHVGWDTEAKGYQTHRELAKMGVGIGLDLVGTTRVPASHWADIVLDLVSSGHAKSIFLSHDAAAAPRGIAESFGKDSCIRGFVAVFRDLLPLLRERGIDQRTIDAILRENPRRLLAIDPKKYPTTSETLLYSEAFDPTAPYAYDWTNARRD